jgi:hypothetical protein
MAPAGARVFTPFGDTGKVCASAGIAMTAESTAAARYFMLGLPRVKK